MFGLPHYCVLCERSISDRRDLCAHCLTTLPWNVRPCSICALPLAIAAASPCELCRRKRPPYTQAFAPFIYRDAPADWVQKLKFENGFREGRVLAELFAEDIASQGLTADVLVPMPLSYRRLLRRGHNQAMWLAKALSRSTGIAVDHRLLRRLRHTTEQSSLAFSARRHNVTGAFEADPKTSRLHVVLVDDVMTSGETLRAASRALLSAGAATVQLCIATRTPKGNSVNSTG